MTRIILGLEPDDMLATCGYIYLTPKGGFAHVQGDGVVALKYSSKVIAIFRYEWDDNTPFYPSYGDGNIERFAAAHGGDLNAIRLWRTTTIIDNEGNCAEEKQKGFTLREGLEGITLSISKEEMQGLDFIAVFTDGIAQIGKPNGSDALAWQDAVQEFMAFKTTTGEFAKRRMIRGIRNLTETGRGPIDDISYAVVRIEPVVEEGEYFGQHSRNS